MAILNTIHKRKAAVITAVILLLFLLGIFNFGMQYLDPPEEYGLTINFGDADFGSGAPVRKTAKSIPPKTIQNKKVAEAVKEMPKEVIQEEVLTDDASKDFTVINKKLKEVKKTPVKEVVKPVQPKELPKSRPSKETQDALRNLLNGNTSDGKVKGEGDEAIEGVKGKEKGDPDANKYYGNTGTGSEENYNLAGRKALSKPKEQPDCEEEGIVVVRITVDKSGKVMSAIAGEKGTTNSASCLLKPAKEAALKTVWNSDSKAPLKQTGTIIYKFSLSK